MESKAVFFFAWLTWNLQRDDVRVGHVGPTNFLEKENILASKFQELGEDFWIFGDRYFHNIWLVLFWVIIELFRHPGFFGLQRVCSSSLSLTAAQVFGPRWSCCSGGKCYCRMVCVQGTDGRAPETKRCSGPFWSGHFGLIKLDNFAISSTFTVYFIFFYIGDQCFSFFF